MLKINLLPRYIRDRRRVPVYAMGCLVVLVVLVLVLGAWSASVKSQVNKLNEDVVAKTAKWDEIQKLPGEAAKIEGEAAADKKRVEFINAVVAMGPKWADALEDLHKWIPANAYLDSWSIKAGKVQWDGYLQVRNPALGFTSTDYMLFYVNVLRCPSLTDIQFKMPSLDTSFTYDIAAGGVSAPLGTDFVPFTISGTLAAPPTLPVFGGGAAAAASPGAAAPGAGAAPASKAATPQSGRSAATATGATGGTATPTTAPEQGKTESKGRLSKMEAEAGA